jgi:hypothetical protein
LIICRELQKALPVYNTETSISGSGNMIIVRSLDESADSLAVETIKMISKCPVDSAR